MPGKFGNLLSLQPTRSSGSAQMKPAPKQPSRSVAGVMTASKGPGGAYPVAGGYKAPASVNTGGGGSYSAPQQQPQPQTGGQPSDGGGDGGGGYDYVGALRSAFQQSRSALEGMLPTYDKDYSNFKQTVEGGLGRAKETLATQNAEDERLYGQDLRKLLQSDKEIRQRQQGVYSGLNALDSSSYKDDVLKQDQYLLENQQGLDAEKRRNFEGRQKEYAAFEADAMGKIAQYANEIQRAKQALQQAIASTNMDEAASIQNYINQMASQAQSLNAQREAMALNLAQLQAQGTDVVGNLAKLNMGGFSNLFGQNLARRMQTAMSRFTPGGGGVQGSGYIYGSSDDEKRKYS